MDLKKFRITAARKRKSLTAFLTKLDDIVPDDMPALVAKVDATVWKYIKYGEKKNGKDQHIQSVLRYMEKNGIQLFFFLKNP